MARIPFRAPDPDEFAGRLSAVLAVVYLLYNQGFDDSAEHGGTAGVWARKPCGWSTFWTHSSRTNPRSSA